MALGRVFILLLGIFSCAHGREIEKVVFADKLDPLVLNGAGLRVKHKFGMDFKVYVAGLYLPAKSSCAAEIIASDFPKILRLVFLRSLDKETLREAWDESFNKNCKADCEAAKPQMKAFNDLMVDVKDQGELILKFDKDSVSVEIKGKEARSGKVTGEAIRRGLLAVFIGEQPPTEDLKKGLLGQ
jgi:hypothetical protein